MAMTFEPLVLFEQVVEPKGESPFPAVPEDRSAGADFPASGIDIQRVDYEGAEKRSARAVQVRFTGAKRGVAGIVSFPATAIIQP